MIDSGSGEQAGRPVHRRAWALTVVFAGGVVGTLARYGLETGMARRGPDWPLATFAINIVGAFLLGLLLESLVRRGPDVGNRRGLRLLAGTGFCGAFTTYSTFALETVELGRDGRIVAALLYAVATVILGGLAAWAGILFGTRVIR